MRLSIVILALLLGIPSMAPGQTVGLEVPHTTGDQLFFFYDARTDRVPFLTISNPAPEDVAVEIAFYPASLASRLGDEALEIPGQGNIVLNPLEAAGGVAEGNLGLVVVTAIASLEDRQPIVPPAALMGAYTQANTGLGAGFGGNPMGRMAVTGNGTRAASGREVDGILVRYQRFSPGVLLVPTYYNPLTLDPPEDDGNRIILVAFNDRYGDRFEVTSHNLTSLVTVADAQGEVVRIVDLPISGVLSTDLQAIAGSLPESSGKVFFTVGSQGNVFGIFSQSLAAFGAGARMTAAPVYPVPGPVCGNGVVESGESCDGDDLAGETCDDVVGGFLGCTGSPRCNDQCELVPGTCDCRCEGDFDCDFEVDCDAVVEGCFIVGACEAGSCVTNPVGNDAVCNGVDPEFPGDPTRCELF